MSILLSILCLFLSLVVWAFGYLAITHSEKRFVTILGFVLAIGGSIGFWMSSVAFLISVIVFILRLLGVIS